MKTINKTLCLGLFFLVYFIGVELLIISKDTNLVFSKTILFNRLIFVLIIGCSYFLLKKQKEKIKAISTIIISYAGLGLLYKETALLNKMFLPYWDSTLIQFDEYLFGFQPSLVFSEFFSNKIFSEFMFFGYFSYYLMPLVVLLLIYLIKPHQLWSYGYTLIGSFLIYYFFFIVFPAIGPQFYFSNPENHIEAQGFFGSTIKLIQKNGEAPTAAFPSSHVGISIIVLLWLFFNFRKIFIYFIPTTILLVLATVYIKAHYFVDVLMGIISAPIVYIFISKITSKICPSK